MLPEQDVQSLAVLWKPPSVFRDGTQCCCEIARAVECEGSDISCVKAVDIGYESSDISGVDAVPRDHDHDHDAPVLFEGLATDLWLLSSRYDEDTTRETPHTREQWAMHIHNAAICTILPQTSLLANRGSTSKQPPRMLTCCRHLITQ